jgi:hypothetical protein
VTSTAYSQSSSPSCTLGPARSSRSCLPSTRRSRAMPPRMRWRTMTTRRFLLQPCSCSWASPSGSPGCRAGSSPGGRTAGPPGAARSWSGAAAAGRAACALPTPAGCLRCRSPSRRAPAPGATVAQFVEQPPQRRLGVPAGVLLARADLHVQHQAQVAHPGRCAARGWAAWACRVVANLRAFLAPVQRLDAGVDVQHPRPVQRLAHRSASGSGASTPRWLASSMRSSARRSASSLTTGPCPAPAQPPRRRAAR